MSTSTDPALEYTEENIKVLRGLEPVRLRPGMYLGDTGEYGLHELLWFLLENSILEVEEGCRNIHIELLIDGGCAIRDDGRGISVHVVEQLGQRFLELAFTQFGFSDRPRRYEYGMGGLHGLGLPCVNVLSRSLSVEVRRDGLLWRQEYERGKPVGPLQPIGRAEGSGTSITFFPDAEIFTTGPTFSYPRIRERLREIACVTPAGTLRLSDRRIEPPLETSFDQPLTLADLLDVHTRGCIPVHRHVIHRKSEDVEVAFRWVHGDTERFVGFVNKGRTDAGTHCNGLLAGVVAAWRHHETEVRRLGRRIRRLRGQIEESSCRRGLLAVVSITLDSPMYYSATKGRLDSPEAIALVSRIAREALADFLRDHPDEAELILAHLRDPRTVDAKTGAVCSV